MKFLLCFIIASVLVFAAVVHSQETPAPEGNNFLDGVKNLFNNINASQIADKAAEFGKSVQAQIPAWTEEAKKVGESIQKAGADLLPKIQEGIASFTGSKNNTSN